jgi:hypothetical protein
VDTTLLTWSLLAGSPRRCSSTLIVEWFRSIFEGKFMNLTQILALLSSAVAYVQTTNADGTLPPIVSALETLSTAAASPDAAPLIAAITAIAAANAPPSVTPPVAPVAVLTPVVTPIVPGSSTTSALGLTPNPASVTK